MADDALPDLSPITETILEPRATRIQLGPPDQYPWLYTFTGEDFLEITSWNAVAGVTITMQGRVHQQGNRINVFKQSHVPNADRTARTETFSIPDGDLLNLSVFCAAGSPILNQTFVRVNVRRGGGSAFTILGTLIQGPITANISRAFPGSPVVGVFEVPGAPRLVTGSTPAASSDVLETVPTGAIWELLTFFAPFTYKIGGLPTFAFKLKVKNSGGSVIGVYKQATAFSSSADGSITWSATLNPSPITDVEVSGSLPAGLLLNGGSTLNIATVPTLLDWQAPRMIIREWLDI